MSGEKEHQVDKKGKQTTPYVRTHLFFNKKHTLKTQS